MEEPGGGGVDYAESVFMGSACMREQLLGLCFGLSDWFFFPALAPIPHQPPAFSLPSPLLPYDLYHQTITRHARMWEMDFICDEMHCDHEEEELKNNHYNVLVSSWRTYSMSTHLTIVSMSHIRYFLSYSYFLLTLTSIQSVKLDSVYLLGKLFCIYGVKQSQSSRLELCKWYFWVI